MNWKRITHALARASAAFADASRSALAAGVAPIQHDEALRKAREAVAALTDAASEVSPALGVRVAEAGRRAFEDARRRAVSRDADAHGLDEGGAAACAAEGTGGLVVDVAARAADEDRLQEAEGTSGGVVFNIYTTGFLTRQSIDDILSGMSVLDFAEGARERAHRAALRWWKDASRHAAVARLDWHAFVHEYGQHGGPAAERARLRKYMRTARHCARDAARDMEGSR